MLKRNVGIFILMFAIVIFSACGSKEVSSNSVDDGSIKVIDDSGFEVVLKEPAKRIISLYSAHTENLYALGLGDSIIGRSTSDIYPVEVLEKEMFDYNGDPEKVIAAEPDLVVIRPFIERKNPQFVETLRKVGIPVVSLYPESFDEFDGYINRLSILTGSEQVAKEKLEAFHKAIDEFASETKGIEPKVNVFFESTQTEYKTVTQDSMPGIAIATAGGVSIAGDVEPVEEGSSIAAFGIERILENSENLDIYVSQRGAMNSGGNYHSISIRPGFHTIKAIQEKKVFMINQKIISSPTFRYVKGIREMTRMFYPEIFDDTSDYATDTVLTREDFSDLIVKYSHTGIFVPTSKYYDKTYDLHTYGFFKDITVDNPSFDIIETAVLSGFIDGYKKNGEEWFYPTQSVSKDDLVMALVLLSEFTPTDKSQAILDIGDSEHPRIVQLLVDNQILKLEDGRFNPKEEVTGNQVIDALKRIDQYNKERGL